MNNYIQLAKKQLRLHDPEELEDALYAAYRELHPNDPEPISRDFSLLDEVLSQLSLQDCDRVWNLTCRLCSQHEQTAFREGVRLGAKLMLSLEEDSSES